MKTRFDRAGRRLAEAADPSELMAWAWPFLPLMREAARQRILSLLLHLIVGQMGRKVGQREGRADAPSLELLDRRFEAFDPTPHIRALSTAFRALSADAQQMILQRPMKEAPQRSEAAAFIWDFQTFLKRFGYMSDSGNDFSASPWDENPDAVLQLVIANDVVARTETTQDAPLSRRERRWARRITDRRLDRERIGATFSQGFHLLHRWALQLGGSLEAQGVLADASDVFFLHLHELSDLANGNWEGEAASVEIAKRKAEMERARHLVLPDMILGDWVPDSVFEESERELRGIPVSRGVYEGPTCVVHSIAESGGLDDGDVLVVPFSDVAWTPLFTRAGAIVAEAGGVLSHSSIVAREACIPAIVSVERACARLSGKRVRVDGNMGRVTILDEAETDLSPFGGSERHP